MNVDNNTDLGHHTHLCSGRTPLCDEKSSRGNRAKWKVEDSRAVEIGHEVLVMRFSNVSIGESFRKKKKLSLQD